VEAGVVNALLADFATGLNPVELFRRSGHEPDPWQAEVLTTRAQQFLLNCSRQVGKSEVVAVVALHEAIYYPPAPILLLSPSERQSGELFRKVMDVFNRLPDPPETTFESILRAEWKNGSRILSLPGKEATIRGFSGVRLILVDEASRVSDSLYTSVRPMLAVSGGRIGLLSTPYGKRGFFFREWTSGEGWQRIQIPATECPRITAEFLAQERLSMPDREFRQEYLCEFAETDDQVFRYDDIMRAVDPDVLPLFMDAPEPEDAGGVKLLRFD
jgi:hypothetical protein